MKISNSNKQQGFSILAVILVIVVVIVAIGVWALSGQTNTSNAGNNTSDIQATSIINDSAAIKLRFDSLTISGSTPSSIVFIPNTASTASAPNMLDPATGLQVPKPNVNAIKTGATVPVGIWVYNPNNFQGRSIGTIAGDIFDHTIILAGVKKTICEKINYTLYGSTSIPVMAMANSDSFVTGATVAAPTTNAATYVSSIAEPAGWMIGCLATTAGVDDNVFFRVLRAN